MWNKNIPNHKAHSNLCCIEKIQMGRLSIFIRNKILFNNVYVPDNKIESSGRKAKCSKESSKERSKEIPKEIPKKTSNEVLKESSKETEFKTYQR
jgi:hypothetical protein